MKVRYKWPNGTGVISLQDNATLRDLVDELRAQTLLNDFGIKFGPPTAMQSVDMNEMTQFASSLGLRGETLTIIPRDASSPQIAPSTKGQEPRQQRVEPQNVNVPWQARDGTLLLRVMPSDNSCLFTAFGGALAQQILPSQLRLMMAEYIQQHADVYSEAVLGSSLESYCRNIVDPDRWGGGIELSILSTVFDIRICTYDVETQNLISFGEGKRDQCILVYSGIHYDRIAFSYSEYPFDNPTLPPEMDRTIWPVEDMEILPKAKELVERLHEAHYFTNTDTLVLRCDITGCGWIGSGRADGQKHAEQTGHSALSEIPDTDTNAVLRKCNMVSCDFIGQGENAIKDHLQDTGHWSFSIIEDQ